MGREKRRELVIIPAQVKIREHVRKVYACRDCEKDEYGVPILKAPIDEPVIKGSFASLAAFLKEFKGYLHTDGYDGYHGLSDDIVIVGCLANARRKFDEALKSMPGKDREGSNVFRGKRYMDKLFELERAFADLTPKERFAKRQELAKPVLEEFFVGLDKFGDMTKTPLGKAGHYAVSQRKYLDRYLLDGRLEISNNRAERSIKPFVIDRKKFLFANTPRGAKDGAIMFSIIETAKDNGLNPFAYLTYIFKNAPNWDIRNNLDYLQFLLPSDVPDSCKAFVVTS